MTRASTLLILIAATMTWGCGSMNFAPLQPPRREALAPAAPTPTPETQSDYMAKAARTDAAAGDESAVETALAWAKKYADAQMRVANLEQENRSLSDRNHTLTAQLDTAKTQLAATQRELAEANTMMKDLEARLAKWQESVLGYRQEMREAQKAQMDALVKVIRLLGGEAPVVSPAAKPLAREARP
ncbi:MAG: hypothetical protein ABFD92_04210 [Planctomycetaceae bacterium]|nr:hypothetical protein [Planctomycetaceae bacterium]